MFFQYKRQKIVIVEKVVKIFVYKELVEGVKGLLKLELSDFLKFDFFLEVIKYYEFEVEILIKEINDKIKYFVFLYCRRGVIYRKLGKLQSVMNDLQVVSFI